MQYKFALHDQLILFLGTLNTLKLPSGICASYHTQTRMLDLKIGLLFEVLSMSPIRDFDESVSWRVKVSLEKL